MTCARCWCRCDRTMRPPRAPRVLDRPGGYGMTPRVVQAAQGSRRSRRIGRRASEPPRPRRTGFTRRRTVKGPGTRERPAFRSTEREPPRDRAGDRPAGDSANARIADEPRAQPPLSRFGHAGRVPRGSSHATGRRRQRRADRHAPAVARTRPRASARAGSSARRAVAANGSAWCPWREMPGGRRWTLTRPCARPSPRPQRAGRSRHPRR